MLITSITGWKFSELSLRLHELVFFCTNFYHFWIFFGIFPSLKTRRKHLILLFCTAQPSCISFSFFLYIFSIFSCYLSPKKKQNATQRLFNLVEWTAEHELTWSSISFRIFFKVFSYFVTRSDRSARQESVGNSCNTWKPEGNKTRKREKWEKNERNTKADFWLWLKCRKKFLSSHSHWWVQIFNSEHIFSCCV